MNNKAWQFTFLLVAARTALAGADTDVSTQASQGLSQGYLAMIAITAVISVVVIFYVCSWFLRSPVRTSSPTPENIPQPFENPQEEAAFQWICEEATRQTQIDIQKDTLAIKRLREGFSKAVKKLENSDTAEINLPFIAVNNSGPCHFKKNLSREVLKKFQD